VPGGKEASLNKSEALGTQISLFRNRLWSHLPNHAPWSPPRAAKGLASFRKHACSRAKVGTAPIQRKAGSCCTLNQECNQRSSNKLVLNYSNQCFFGRGGRARLHPSIHPQYNDFLFFLNSRCNLHHCTLVGNLTRIAQTLATIWWIQICHLSRSSFLAPLAINFSDPFCEAHQSFTRRRASNPRCERISTAERR